MRRLSLSAGLLVILVAVPYVFAGNYVRGYSPAGRVTVGQAGGPPLTSSPALFTYSNFNSNAYQSHYYGVNYVANVAQSNVLTAGNMAFQGYNPSTGNTINEANCGISKSGAASSDVFLPNTVLNSNQATCN